MTPHRILSDPRRRYEVRYIDAETGQERVFAACDQKNGWLFFELVKRLPKAKNPFVVDTFTGEVTREAE